jgi:hypothetical protein
VSQPAKRCWRLGDHRPVFDTWVPVAVLVDELVVAKGWEET